VDFGVTEQLLITYSVFSRHWRRNGSIMGHYISYKEGIVVLKLHCHPFESFDFYVLFFILYTQAYISKNVENWESDCRIESWVSYLDNFWNRQYITCSLYLSLLSILNILKLRTLVT
jgi:hypothetical protein